MNAQKTLAPALGWFSVALGATAVTAPKQLSRAIGTDGHSTLMRSIGLREIGAGVSILSRRKPAPGLWARVAGDAMDIALVLAAMRNERNDKQRLGMTLASLMGITAADTFAAMAPSTYPRNGHRRAAFTKAVSINARASQLFELLSDPATLALIPGLENATLTLERSDAPRSLVWQVRNTKMFDGTFEIEIWEHAAPDRGSALRVDAYTKGAGLNGVLRKAIAEIPGDEFALGLHRLKNIVEVGYVVSAESPSGRQKMSEVTR